MSLADGMIRAPTAEAVSGPKHDSQHAAVLVDTDVESTGTEVSKPSSDGEMVDGPPAESSPQQENFKLAIPEPLEKASQVAVLAVKDWWAQLEPLLQMLQAQLLKQLDPYLKASAASFARVQAELAPHTEQAAAVVAAWKEKLEPHAKQALDAVKTATEAVRTQAYEPALVAINAATIAVQAHAQEAAALATSKAAAGLEASKEWLAAQKPILIKAHELAMTHAAAALAALLEWKKQIEPLAKAQLLLTQERALAMSVQAGAQMKELTVATQAQLVVLGGQIGQQAEAAKTAATPHMLAAKAWAEEQGQAAYTKVEPALRPVVAWSEETGKKLAPHIEPVAKAVDSWVRQSRTRKPRLPHGLSPARHADVSPRALVLVPTAERDHPCAARRAGEAARGSGRRVHAVARSDDAMPVLAHPAAAELQTRSVGSGGHVSAARLHRCQAPHLVTPCLLSRRRARRGCRASGVREVVLCAVFV